MRIHLFLHPAGGRGGCCAGRWPCTARSRRPEGRISRSAYGGGAANARRSRRGAGRSCHRRSWACPLRVKHRSEITARRRSRGQRCRGSRGRRGHGAARRCRRRCAGRCRGVWCSRTFIGGTNDISTRRLRRFYTACVTFNLRLHSGGASARPSRRAGRSRSTGRGRAFSSRGGRLGGSWGSRRRCRGVGRAHFSGASR